MTISIRARRRQRAYKKILLDKIALAMIRANMLWSMETWGGTRCGGCGKKARPHWLLNYSGYYGNAWVTAFGYICHKTKCPGEDPEWMIKAWRRQSKK